MAELISPGRTGALFAPGNASELASTVHQLLANADNLKQMRTEARREFELRYTAAANHRMIQEIYQSAIAQRFRDRRAPARLTPADA